MTDLWITFIETLYSGSADNLNVTLNRVEVWYGGVSASLTIPKFGTIHVENPNIIEGVNILCLEHGASGRLSIHQISVFIEYEYQAR